MSVDWTLYGPPVAALVFGLLGGGLLAMRMPSSEEEGRSVQRDGRVDDLSGTREDAVAALRALEQERLKLPESEYHAQRRELLERGASALKELDTGPWKPESPLDSRVAALEAQRDTLGDDAVNAAIAALRGQPPQPAGSSALTGAGWTLGLLAVAGLLWYQLAGDAVPRGAGVSMTGNSASEAPAPAPPPPRPAHPMKATWTEALAADPNNLEALNGLTEVAIGERDLKAAMDLSRRALELAPKDLDARTHRAVLQAAVGLSDRAFELLAGVRDENPEFSKAWVYTGLLALDQGRYDLAEEAIEQAIKLEPDRAAFLAQRLAEAKQMSQASSEVLLTGTVSAPGITPSGTEILFVSLRDPAGGPPLAALRLPPTLPADITVTAADLIAMGGAPRPVGPEVQVTVRLDTDGNPMTRDGPAAKPVVVPKGSTGHQFILQAP